MAMGSQSVELGKIEGNDAGITLHADQPIPVRLSTPCPAQDKSFTSTNLIDTTGKGSAATNLSSSSKLVKIMSDSNTPSSSSSTTPTARGVVEDGEGTMSSESFSSFFASPQGNSLGAELDAECFATPPSEPAQPPSLEGVALPVRLPVTPVVLESDSITSTFATPLSSEQANPIGKHLTTNTTIPAKPEKPPRKISADKLLTSKISEITHPVPASSSNNTGQPATLSIDFEGLPPPSDPAPRHGENSGRDGGSNLSMKHSTPSRRADMSRKLAVVPGYMVVDDDSYPEQDPENSPPSKEGGVRPSMADISAAAMRFTARQWTCLIVFGIADLAAAMVVSIQAPFYPAEAEKKGATASEYGLVFGVYELTIFLTSPFLGKYMNKIGPKVVFNSGIILIAVSCIAFGLLDEIDNHVLFITLSFIFRITEALGAAATTTGSFTIISCEFRKTLSTTFASLETFYGLGLIIGPTVGGALFQVGGYILPFIVTGVSLLLIGIMASFVMPKTASFREEDEDDTKPTYGIMSILRLPGVMVATLALAVMASSIGFLSATLEPHLRPFNLTPLEIGLMFIIYGAVYAITAPLFGWICDHVASPIYVLLFGAILIFTGFLLIGPAPFIPIDTTVWVTAVGLVIMGLGLSATLVASFLYCLSESMANGLPDNVSTYGVISGLWTSSVSLGAFLGPSIGGFLYDEFSFRPGTYYVLGTQGLMVVVIVVYLFTKPKRGSSGDGENVPLLCPPPISPILSANQSKDVELASDQNSGVTITTTGTSGTGTGYGTIW